MPSRSALPPGLLIRTGKWVWTTLWQTMMSKLAPSDGTGAYVRPESQFRDRVRVEAEAKFPAASGRYYLIAGLGCPWAHRTLVVRSLKGLTEAIPLIVVYPSSDQGIWTFEQPFATCQTLPQLYQIAQTGYSGRATVPILWDSQTRQIVNNESAEMIVILNQAFDSFAQRPDLDLYPAALQPEIDRWNEQIYHAVNNGVYRCGFAQSQAAYDQAVADLFATLDLIDTTLANQRYLCGHALTLADVRLFTTLFRFDIVYHGLFKCNRRRIQDYTHLGAYLRDLYQLPGVAETCHLEAVKRDYYGNLFPLNPGGIIPDGPDITDLQAPHGREKLSASMVVKAATKGQRAE
ncbi:glutathione S-transferase family protein [Almyronema epifaneia]|uniref:Glutathione S-transferase family protein n=1 Tax=Almyronema epifaneia S1 TaxID=2991925 RepID=A0ABW6IE77_9CYAN